MKVVFLITNPNHHVEVTLPIALALKEKGRGISYISLCELRRMKTPEGLFNEHNIPYHRLNSFGSNAKPSDGQKTLGKSNAKKRLVTQKAFWWLKLRRFIKQHLQEVDKLVFLNDAAFPGNFISALAERKGIERVLLQEGIRFPLPNENESSYGASGVEKILSWGDASKHHFEKVSKAKTKVFAAGSARIDHQLKWFENHPKSDSQKRLGLFTNPIDDMGYCTTDTKVKMIQEFVEQYALSLNAHNVHVTLKTHPREDPDIYTNRISAKLNHFSVQRGDIKSAIAYVDVGVIMASTVGLELVLAGKHLIQLKIPSFGYPFDYVDQGVAIAEDALDTDKLLNTFEGSDNHYSNYVQHHFANLGASVETAVDLILTDV